MGLKLRRDYDFDVNPVFFGCGKRPVSQGKVVRGVHFDDLPKPVKPKPAKQVRGKYHNSGMVQVEGTLIRKSLRFLFSILSLKS